MIEVQLHRLETFLPVCMECEHAATHFVGKAQPLQLTRSRLQRVFDIAIGEGAYAAEA